MVDIVSARVLVVARGTGLATAVKQVTLYWCVLGSCEATKDCDNVKKDQVTITEFLRELVSFYIAHLISNSHHWRHIQYLL